MILAYGNTAVRYAAFQYPIHRSRSTSPTSLRGGHTVGTKRILGISASFVAMTMNLGITIIGKILNLVSTVTERSGKRCS